MTRKLGGVSDLHIVKLETPRVPVRGSVCRASRYAPFDPNDVNTFQEGFRVEWPRALELCNEAKRSDDGDLWHHWVRAYDADGRYIPVAELEAYHEGLKQ